MIINYFYAFRTEDGNIGCGTFEATVDGDSPSNKDLFEAVNKLVEKRHPNKEFSLTALNRI